MTDTGGEPRVAGRDEILAALTGRDRLTPVEVTDDNLEAMRAAFAPDVGPGNLVWAIPDTTFRVIIHGTGAQHPPLHGALRWPHGGHNGIVMLFSDGAPCIRDATGLVFSLVTGAHLVVTPRAPA